MIGSTVDTCSASVLGAFGRITHIFYGEVDSKSEVFSLRSHAEWRSVLSRCSSFQSWYALLAFGNLEITLTRFTWLAACVMMAGQCAGTGPCKLVSVTACCIDRCGVAIHTHQVVSQTATTATATAAAADVNNNKQQDILCSFVEIEFGVRTRGLSSTSCARESASRVVFGPFMDSFASTLYWLQHRNIDDVQFSVQ